METVFCGCRFQDSSVLARCERLRGLEDLRIAWARAAILRVVFWSVFRAGGAHVVKRCSVSLDVLGKLTIRNPSRASLVYAGGRMARGGGACV